MRLERVGYKKHTDKQTSIYSAIIKYLCMQGARQVQQVGCLVYIAHVLCTCRCVNLLITLSDQITHTQTATQTTKWNLLLGPGWPSTNKAKDLIRLTNKSNCQIAELVRNLSQSRKEEEGSSNADRAMLPVANHRIASHRTLKWFLPCASQVVAFMFPRTWTLNRRTPFS